MSSLRSNEIEIPAGKPFDNCKLDREKYAKVLTQIIENYSDGFVLAINNKWGEGKTTFIKMWQKYLALPENGYKVIYFNAWEHDFGQDPMAAILSEIKSLDIGNEDKLNGIIKKAAKLSIHAIPILLTAAANKYIDSETFAEGIKKLSEKSIDAFQSEVDEYKKKKEGLDEFKKALEEYVVPLDKPVVFIIDELDRCNPKYAVEVLEIIKHFFSVSGIVFILSIDKEQLGNAIRGYYGSDLIKADEYLWRFIDLEYSIPKPSIDQFNKYLFETYKFADFFTAERMGKHQFKNEPSTLLKMANIVFDKRNASLREQEKIFILTRLLLFSFEKHQFVFPALFFLLVYLKTLKPDIFSKIERKYYSCQELSNEFFELFKSIEKSNDELNFAYVEALLLWFYNNGMKHEQRLELLNNNGESITTPIKSKIDEAGNKGQLARAFSIISNQYEFNHLNLKYLIKKINLTEPLVFGR
ncbi:KAP family P-loop NTPase fold protein [Algoriphagus sediminis]|uniref:P-loop NTPase fold protein n=1 Tax=Algoriphagus sediminis TaxID=3057113 RepID=A0ABT7YDG9_9BACT|nr:P-loop NTPase fold protein [Algoriphagus sediminis]MDN3204577.1 P-loop NTPase fold protein [Algoriphagus sediminis]